MTVTSSCFSEMWPETEVAPSSTTRIPKTSARVEMSPAPPPSKETEAQTTEDIIAYLEKELAHRTSMFVISLMLVVSYLTYRVRILERHMQLRTQGGLHHPA